MLLPSSHRTPQHLHPVPATGRPEQLVGYVLYQGGKNLGELEETVELGHRWYYVVDARHWSFGARKLLPVAAVSAIDPAQSVALTGVDVDALRRSPDFDSFLLSNDRYVERVEDHFDQVSEPDPSGPAEGHGPGPSGS